MKLLKTQTQSIKKLTDKVVKSIAEVFAPAKNSRYGSEDLARSLVEICAKKSSAERHSNPSPDTILRRLHQAEESEFNKILEKLNAKLLRRLHPPRKPLLALDYKIKGYHGEEQPALVSDSNLPGTNLGIKFANLSIVERGKTFTLRTKQVGPLTFNVQVVEEMLGYAKRFVEPRIILLDREFYSAEVIKVLESRNQSFIMPARHTEPIKRLCKAFERGEVPPVVDYTVEGSRENANVKLTFVRRETKRGLEIHPFISNLELKPEEIARLYGWRWRIETNNRELEKFSALTTSTSMKLRRLYYSLAALLYNLWIVVRGGSELPRAYQFKRIIKQLLRTISDEIRNGLPPPPTSL